MQFGFRHQYSTSHALINITENIRKALGDANIGCRVFVDLQKAFDTDTVSKITICEVPNDWYKSYVSNLNQYIAINGRDSGHAAINCGIPQGSALVPILLLLLVNSLNQAIKCFKVHHFADDTNL